METGAVSVAGGRRTRSLCVGKEQNWGVQLCLHSRGGRVFSVDGFLRKFPPRRKPRYFISLRYKRRGGGESDYAESVPAAFIPNSTVIGFDSDSYLQHTSSWPLACTALVRRESGLFPSTEVARALVKIGTRSTAPSPPHCLKEIPEKASLLSLHSVVKNCTVYSRKQWRGNLPLMICSAWGLFCFI